MQCAGTSPGLELVVDYKARLAIAVKATTFFSTHNRQVPPDMVNKHVDHVARHHIHRVRSTTPFIGEFKRIVWRRAGAAPQAGTTPQDRRPAADYTARVIPRCNGVAIPLEDAQILWQR
jgi:hypothetical protein